MPELDCIVIGGGVVGLAIAKQLSGKCHVSVLEKNAYLGMETSSRNSGVIHAGMYYPRDFLKTRLCLRGRELLYNYCETKDIAHQRCGKLIVASTDKETPELKKFYSKAQQLAIPSQYLTTSELQEKEPAVIGTAAIYSPQTGIINSAAYMQQLEIDIIANGSQILNHHQVNDISVSKEGFLLRFSVGEENHQVSCKTLINAAGLYSHQLSSNMGNPLALQTPKLYFCKGQYFAYSGKETFKHLIYPMPNANNTGLGIHLTLNIDGSIKFGPDAHYMPKNTINYRIDMQAKDHFLQAIQQYLPQIHADDLQPDFAGIRPKLNQAFEAAADFNIQGPAEHGIDNLIQCFGIESPGLTASLAIGEYVETLLWP